MKTLLEKAKEAKTPARRVVISKELIDLAIAWMKDEVTTGAVCSVLGKKNGSGNTMYRICLALRQAYANGSINIQGKKA